MIQAFISDSSGTGVLVALVRFHHPPPYGPVPGPMVTGARERPSFAAAGGTSVPARRAAPGGQHGTTRRLLDRARRPGMVVPRETRFW
jgi:hypothetical protein